MVFVTQVIMIAFVVTDIDRTETHQCLDGTKGCPVVGTLGGWCFYILGFLLSLVFLLGPKTKFGHDSEQNPAFWIQLLLCANGKNEANAVCRWHVPEKDQAESHILRHGDYRIWLRLFMSFLVNGVGFHILVHALPIQVAGQSSLTGVVARAVGMIYLVDLDDIKGPTLTITAEKEEAPEQPKPDEHDEAKNAGINANTTLDTDDDDEYFDDFQREMQKIIDNAKADMDALAADRGLGVKKRDRNNDTSDRNNNAYLYAAMLGDTTEPQERQQTDNTYKNSEARDDDALDTMDNNKSEAGDVAND
jgi:hypothetical protein